MTQPMPRHCYDGDQQTLDFMPASERHLPESSRRSYLELLTSGEATTARRHVLLVVKQWGIMAEEWWPLANQGVPWPNERHTPTRREAAWVAAWLKPEHQWATYHKRLSDRDPTTGQMYIISSIRCIKCLIGGGSASTIILSPLGQRYVDQGEKEI